MCGTEHKLEAHHILPRHLGGSDHPRNLMTLCRDCHMAVHEDLGDLDEYRHRLRDPSRHEFHERAFQIVYKA